MCHFDSVWNEIWHSSLILYILLIGFYFIISSSMSCCSWEQHIYRNVSNVSLKYMWHCDLYLRHCFQTVNYWVVQEIIFKEKCIKGLLNHTWEWSIKQRENKSRTCAFKFIYIISCFFIWKSLPNIPVEIQAGWVEFIILKTSRSSNSVLI